ncbi:biotin--[acetyl-CoA-carboxylase] ligase [Massilibacterium senegalense]|uniref:biotin--[acetyl-CoA-carboxylase] ligase n=1 Tax=Massilibacterium senegalense TaxID=1632858 RepID=UPI00078315FC|nr:biotin--[acetyl-CoA-carboxylase] ligase [Massilibacterium senegalense]
MASTLREKLLQILYENEGEFISGQKISEMLDCSRTAVWKNIEELRKEGFELEAVQKKGYRIISKPDRLAEHDIQFNLKTKTFGQIVYAYESITSTQEVAKQLSVEGAKEGTIVVAEEQTKGRGRMNRPWNSKKSDGIYFSLILKPKISIQEAPQLTLLAAVGIVRAIKKVTDLDCHIKWPNDVLLNGRKLVGILTELQAEADQIHSVMIGIGINVNQKRFPKELEKIATSLYLQMNKKIERVQVLQAVLEELEELYEDYIQYGFDVVKMLWESYAISIGKEIHAHTLRGTITGTAKGITKQGVLLLEDANGVVHEIYSADIEIASTK